MFNLKTLVFLTVVATTLSEVVEFRPCKNYTGKCVIHEVRIDPCKEAATNDPCKIRRGKSAKISFDFTPDFDADTLDGRVYWTSDIDLPLTSMETDACKATKCPIVRDQRRTYSIELPISRKFPPNQYEIKWRLTHGDDKECCLQTAILLPR